MPNGSPVRVIHVIRSNPSDIRYYSPSPVFFWWGPLLNFLKRRNKSERDYPIGTEKMREVTHILLITVLQYMLRYSQPAKSYGGRANSMRTSPAPPYIGESKMKINMQ